MFFLLNIRNYFYFELFIVIIALLLL